MGLDKARNRCTEQYTRYYLLKVITIPTYNINRYITVYEKRILLIKSRNFIN